MRRPFFSALLLVFSVVLLAPPTADAQIVIGGSVCDSTPLMPTGTLAVFPGSMTCNKSVVNNHATMVANCSAGVAQNGATCRPNTVKTILPAGGMRFFAGARAATNNPICSWTCTNGTSNPTVTLMAPGLPVELMDFDVAEENTGAAEDEDEPSGED